VDSPLGAASRECGQYPWSDGTPCTEKERNRKLSPGSQHPRKGMRHGLPTRKLVPKCSGWVALTLRSIASDFCRSKFRAVGRWGKGGSGTGAVFQLPWPASGGCAEPWGLSKTSLPSPPTPQKKGQLIKIVWSDPDSHRSFWGW
jgi:hypothetical protein